LNVTQGIKNVSPKGLAHYAMLCRV